MQAFTDTVRQSGPFKNLNDQQLAANTKYQQQLKDMQRNMSDFERRMAGNKADIALTYQQLARLYKENTSLFGNSTTLDNRLQLGREFMYQVAHPTDISQGNFPTCGVAAVEVRMYTKYPSEAARFFADAALYRTFETAGHDKVTLNSADLIPDKDTLQWQPGNGKRSYASQVFEIAAVNIVTQNNGSDSQYGKYADASGTPTEGVVYHHSDTVELKKPALNDYELKRVGDSIHGVPEKDSLIIHESSAIKDKDPGILVKSQQDFQQQLLNLKAQNRLPVVTIVDSGVGPFNSNTGYGGRHAVTITDITSSGKGYAVSFDNQWSKSSDRTGQNALNLSDAYKSLYKAP